MSDVNKKAGYSYDVYLFDFDYTLADSEKGIVKCFELLLAQEGYPINPKDEIKRTIGMPMVDALAVLTGETDKDLLWELREKYTVFADKYMTENTVVYAETIPTLRKIKSAGSKVAIISNKTRRRIMQTLNRDNFADAVDFVVGSEDVKHLKPAADGLLAALAHLHVDKDKEKVLYIGDNVIDAKTAQNAGVDFAAVLTGNNTASDFSGLSCVKLMDNLSQLP